MDNNKAAQILENSINYIKEKGWTQHFNRDSQGRACMLGSLDVANPYEYSFQLPITALQNVLVERTGEWWIAQFNDTPGRTKEEVIDVMETAVRKLRENG